MATALTLYGLGTASTTLPSARIAGTVGGGSSSTSSVTKVGSATGYGEIVPAGDTSDSWAALSSLPGPTGKGWILDDAILEGSVIMAGAWTPATRVQGQTSGGTALSGGVIVGDIYMRFYKRSSGGVYTAIGQVVKTAQSLGSFATFTFTATTFPEVDFAVGDKLYYDVWVNVTHNASGASDTQFKFGDIGVSGLGRAGQTTLTPGYTPLPPTIVNPGGITVFMAGQDISNLVDESTIDMTLAIGQGPGVGSGGSATTSQMVFNARMGPTATAKGAGEGPFSGTDLVAMGELLIYDGTSALVFGGYVVDFQDMSKTLEIITQVTATDYWQYMDRIIVNETFAGQSDTFIIKYLLTKYAPWVDQTLIPSTVQYIFERRAFRARTLRETLQIVADTTGYNIWMDANRKLHYLSLSALSTSPISLSDDPDYVVTFPHLITKYEWDQSSIVNQVLFYGGKNSSPDFSQDLSVQANGNNTTMALLYFPHEASDGVIHVFKNSVDLVMYSVYDTDATHALISAGGTADVLINRDAETLIFDTAPLATDTLTCLYRYQTPLVVQLESSASITKFAGTFQAKIVDENVFDSATAIQRCRVMLSEQAYGLVSGELKTWTAGIQPGQLLFITNSVRGLSSTYQVQKVEMKSIGNGFFEWTVDFGAWTWGLIDALIWTARSAASADTDDTEEGESTIEVHEGVLASTVTEVWVKTTTTSGGYYSRMTTVGDGHDAYSGFFSVTS